MLRPSAALLFAVLIVGYDPMSFYHRKGAPRGSFDGFVRRSHSFDLSALFVISDDPVSFLNNEEVAGDADNFFVG